jgi:hypothetical protein
VVAHAFARCKMMSAKAKPTAKAKPKSCGSLSWTRALKTHGV